MLSRPVKHIYGQYVQNEKEYVYYQNLGVDLNAGTYIFFFECFDWRDYFIIKTFVGIVNAVNKNPMNKKIWHCKNSC